MLKLPWNRLIRFLEIYLSHSCLLSRFLLPPLPLILSPSLFLSSSLLPFLSISLSCSIALHVTPLLLTSPSISLNISKEWITLGCHLALAKNSFLWVKCFKLSSLTGTISYNNYMDGPWLGALSFFPPPPLFIYMLKRSRLLFVQKEGAMARWER